jgi:hypothetical protein
MDIKEDLRRWFKEKWTSQSGEECGSYSGKGRVKCRPSKRVSEKSPQTWGEMDKSEKEKAVSVSPKTRKEEKGRRKGKGNRKRTRRAGGGSGTRKKYNRKLRTTRGRKR